MYGNRPPVIRKLQRSWRLRESDYETDWEVIDSHLKEAEEETEETWNKVWLWLAYCFTWSDQIDFIFVKKRIERPFKIIYSGVQSTKPRLELEGGVLCATGGPLQITKLAAEKAQPRITAVRDPGENLEPGKKSEENNNAGRSGYSSRAPVSRPKQGTPLWGRAKPRQGSDKWPSAGKGANARHPAYGPHVDRIWAATWLNLGMRLLNCTL